MKYLLSITLIILLGCSESDQVFHSDHTVFGINKLKPRADFFGFENEGLAKANKR